MSALLCMSFRHQPQEHITLQLKKLQKQFWKNWEMCRPVCLTLS